MRFTQPKRRALTIYSICVLLETEEVSSNQIEG